tara:strand:- start:40 stop:525 length:486 start_codon:yes stop_codon:yes gene_type:complete
MTRNIQASLLFRKNTPGRRLTSIKNLSKYPGQLYTFQYTSYGPVLSKQRPNKDKRPLLLLAVRNGEKVWKAKNGKRYVYGFNLNYLSPMRRLSVIKDIIKMVTDRPGEQYSYQDIKTALNLPSSKEDSIFRKYDVRGSKLRYLKEVDLDTYASYLEESLGV